MTQQSQTLDTIRTDLVGSFLRPPRLKDAHIRRSRQQVSDEEVRQVQDEAIRGPDRKAGGRWPAGGDRRGVPPRQLHGQLHGCRPEASI